MKEPPGGLTRQLTRGNDSDAWNLAKVDAIQWSSDCRGLLSNFQCSEYWREDKFVAVSGRLQEKEAERQPNVLLQVKEVDEAVMEEIVSAFAAMEM